MKEERSVSGRDRCIAEPFIFTLKSKTALVNKLAILLERKAITLPKPELWPVGIDELESYQFSVTDAGNVRTNAPSGNHDDCVIATALAVWSATNRPRVRFSMTNRLRRRY